MELFSIKIRCTFQLVSTCRENSPVHYHVRIADIVQNIVKGQIVAFCKTAYDSPNAVI